MNAVTDDTRAGRKGTEPNRPRHPQGSRDGTPSSQQARKAGNKAPHASKANESSLNGPAPRSESAAPSSSVESVPLNGVNVPAAPPHTSKSSGANSMLYKPDPKAESSTKSDQPWGAKSGTMANGKDFWLELRKQFTALQQNGGTSQGG